MKKVLFMALPLLWMPSAMATNTISVKLMSADIAQRIASAALAHCAKKGNQVTVVVAGRDGRPQVLLRHALASPVTLKIARKKAVTAANMRQPSADLDEAVARASRKLTRMRGGLPIAAGGHFYGGVGVSGSTGAIDEECAQAGLDAVQDDLEFEE